MQKPNVARLIVKAIRSSEPPGRFLKKNDDGIWVDIGDKKATEKSSQALREKPVQDKKSLQKLTPESVPVYMNMQGFVGGVGVPPGATLPPGAAPPGAPQYLYYGLIPAGQHMSPTMSDIMHSAVQDSKVDGGGEEKSQEREATSAMEDINTAVKEQEEAKEKIEECSKGDSKEGEMIDKKRKGTDFEDAESPSESKQPKVKDESKEEAKVVSI